MRVKHSITISRAMEVLSIDRDGRLFFRMDNGHHRAGEEARLKVKSNTMRIRIDNVSMPASKVAWMIQAQEYPKTTPLTRNHSRHDFRLSNLTLSVDDLIWGDQK